MNGLTRLLILMSLVLGLWGCATAEPVKVETAPVERATFFYAGAMELPLKSTPEPGSSTAATVSLNERVQQLERRGGWFLVRADDGRQGWANDRDLGLSPKTELYVRRWGVSLKSEPQGSSKSLARLRANDQVTLQDKNPQGWAKITVARTGNTGWLELKNLSLSKVAVRRVTRPKSGTPTAEEAVEPEASTPEAPAAPSGLAPKAATAAPAPPKPAPSTAPRKAKPGMFEPF
ncbi:MAG: hypothetical protein KKD99_04480 [Proteobacteria bacterium]|nr:hypothetical protein [Pseudomonadota bacterium]MBU4356783.1 hypothetical protein [Pseudomonadota bacterium]MBU4447825.1 hypothetical protein [Pseudomonadota bacterium]MCG2772982.1 hypothetical protein [Desulfobacterales bacterium]